jgi:hypothetical protein
VAALAGLAAVVLLGAYLRVQNLTGGGLDRDDAWVALAAHVRPLTALKLGATAPGFTLVERTWILLDPNSTRWAQLLPFAVSVAAIIAMFALVRYSGLNRWWALAGAYVMALSPIALLESTHVKQYGTDILLCCLMLALYEAVRRDTSTRHLAVLVIASVVVLGISASIVPVLIGVWLALLLTSLRDPTRRSRVLITGAVGGGLCVALLVLISRHVSAMLHKYWLLHFGFISTRDVSGFVRTLWRTLHTLTADLLPLHGGGLTVATWALIALLVLGATRGERALACTLSIVAALAASTAGRIPLGTGRTDEVLFPAVILLALFGAQRAAALVMRFSTRHGAARAGVAVLAVASAVLVVTVAVPAAATPIQRSVGYPGVDLPPLMRQVDAQRRSGDLLFVESPSRYPWALAYPQHVKIVLGAQWGAGFTPVSTDPHVFVVPTEWWEGGYDPTTWPDRVEKASRLWFIGTGPPGYRQISTDFRTLVANDWHVQKVIRGLGGYAALMTR